jgi:hypothetical protein
VWKGNKKKSQTPHIIIILAVVIRRHKIIIVNTASLNKVIGLHNKVVFAEIGIHGLKYWLKQP